MTSDVDNGMKHSVQIPLIKYKVRKWVYSLKEVRDHLS